MIAKKVLLIGNFGVGKTSLVRRFVLNEFSEDYISTIGVRVSSKIISYNNEEIKLMIWDVAGTKDDEKVPKAYFLGSNAAMYVFDLSREETYIDIAQKLATIRELSGLTDITVVGNKRDLITDEKIKEIKELIPVNIDAITSAKDDKNVIDAFNLLTKQSLN